jgi:hypothetical protein
MAPFLTPGWGIASTSAGSRPANRILVIHLLQHVHLGSVPDLDQGSKPPTIPINRGRRNVGSTGQPPRWAKRLLSAGDGQLAQGPAGTLAHAVTSLNFNRKFGSPIGKLLLVADFEIMEYWKK